MKKLIRTLKVFFPYLLLILIQIPLFFPFFHKGFFPSHDNVQVVRVFEIFQSLSYGDIPPRWSANLLFGRGYPLYIFYGPLPYLIGAFFVLLLNNFLLATKTVFIFSFIIGPLGIYLLVKEWWGKLPALTAAVAFSLAPYRAVDVYVRGNLGEFFSFSLFPIVFWINCMFLKTFDQKNNKLWGLIFVFALFLLEISHNISCFIFLFFLGLFNLYYLFFEGKKQFRWKSALNLLLLVLFSLILSSFYLIPLLYETKFVLVGQFRDSPYWEYFLTLGKLWNSAWGWGGYTDKIDAVSLQLGKSLIIFSFLSIVLNFLIKNKNKRLITFFSIILLFFVFMELRISDFIWRNVSLLHYFQFPWRLHVILTLSLAILSGALVYLLNNINFFKKQKSLVLTLVFIITVLLYYENLRFFHPRIFSDAPAASETTTWNDEYLPKWVKIKPEDYTGTKAQILSGEAKIEKESWGYLKKEFLVETKKDSVLQIAHVYYPGWTVYVNNKEKNINYQNDYGLMRVELSKGVNKVVFIFKRTSWRLVSDIISIAGFLFWSILLVKEAKRYVTKKQK